MPWSPEDIRRLVEVEARLQEVDPQLALGVARQESGFNPTSRSPKGAYGVMQLMPGTARALGINAQDVGDNIRGGITYLKQQLTRYGGDPRLALAAYNAGPSAVDAYKDVPPFKETRGYVQRILGAITPASAEAAPSPPAATGRSRLDEIEAELARREAQDATQQVPQATTTPPPVSQAGAAPGRATEAAEPPSDLVIDIEKASPSAPTPNVRPWWQRQLMPQAPTPTQTGPPPNLDAELQAQLAPAQKGMPGLLIGGAAGTAGRMLGQAAQRVLPWFGRAAGVLPVAGEAAGSYAGRKANVALGYEEPGTVGDVLSVGLPLVAEGLRGTVLTSLARSRAGKAIAQADEQTRTAQQQWQQEVDAVRAAQQAGQQADYETALIKAKQAQNTYRQKLAVRDNLITAHQQEYEEAVRAAQEDAYTTARQAARDEQAAAQAGQQQYQEAVTGQQQALGEARAIPGRYTPDTPSWVLYDKFGEAARGSRVPLGDMRQGVADMRAGRGLLPTGETRPFPAVIERRMRALEQADAVDLDIQTIRNELRELGPLTRSSDGNVRGPAKQLYGIYAEAMEASPVANDLLRQANATFRREMALQDVQEWLRPGHGIVRIDNQGRQTINVGALMTRLEKQVGDDALFRGSFTPDELASLRRDVGRLAGTPTMPRGGPPPGAQPQLLPGATQDLPARLQQPPAEPALPKPPSGQRVRAWPEARIPPQPEPVTPQQVLGERPPWKGRTTTLGGMAIVMNQLGVPSSITTAMTALGAGHLAQQQVRYSIAQALLDPRKRALVLAAIDDNGVLNPRLYGALRAAMTPAEKKAVERESRAR